MIASRSFLRALATCALLSTSWWGAPLRAAPTAAELLFIPDGGGPALLIHLEEEAGEAGFKRRAEVAWAVGDRSWSRTAEDTALGRRDLGLAMPSPPTAIQLEPAPQGGFVLSIDDLGPWQEGIPEVSPPRGQRPATQGPPVLGATAARLWVGPSEGIHDEAAEVSGALFGNRARLSGRVLIRRGQPLSGLIGEGAELDFSALTVLDARNACGDSIPGAMWASRPGEVLQVSVGKVACLGDGRAIAEVSIRRVDKRGAKVARATLVTKGSPSSVSRR